MVKSGKRKK